MAAGRWLRNWFGRRHPADGAQRWIVVDCETSGLDPAHDELLSIGAVAVQVRGLQAAIVPSDSFEAVIRPQRTSATDNILVHGIGRAAQEAGLPAERAMEDFVRWAGAAPLIAFRAPFDRAFILRACTRDRVTPPPGTWLDLAELAPALCPQQRADTLDAWLAAFGLAPVARHSAPGDALATALLLIRLLAIAGAQGAHGVQALRHLSRSARWIA